jgi:signal transduction histidine kinase
MDPPSSAAPFAATLCAFQEAREAFFVFRPHDQFIVAANAAARRATGLTDDELRARRFTDLFVADGGPGPADLAPQESHVLRLRADGLGREAVRLRVYPVPADPPLGLAVVEPLDDELLDQRTREKERVQAELAKVKEELVRQTRLATLGQMSASVAHDLRNPLGAVRNAAYYLSRKVPPTEPKWAEYLAIIDREVIVCDQIITNMLELARSKEPAPETLDLGELVRTAFRRARPPSDVQLHFRAAPEPFLVRADPVQLRQVFDNLIKNALDAVAGRGDIRVEAAAEDGGCAVAISDSGPGVSAEVRVQLFEPLFSTKAKGTGLGLWICRQVAERHGGTIESIEIPGRGLAFRLLLPA